MRSVLVIKCFQILLSILTLQNKHSLLFGCVTHLGIVIGKMLGMERLFYIKEKQGMQTSQMLSSILGFWKGAHGRGVGCRGWVWVVHHSGILKQSQSWLSIPARAPPLQARQALCCVPCSGPRVESNFAQEASGWTLFYFVLPLFGIHSSSLVPVAHSAYRGRTL